VRGAARHGHPLAAVAKPRMSIAISSSTRRGIGAPRGTLTMSARRGLNRLRFSGRFGRWALLAGAYVATIRAASTGETVVAAPVSFRMVTRRR